MFTLRRSTSSTLARTASPVPDAPDNESQKLNEALERLNEIFPNHEVDMLRQKLANCSSETKLHVVTTKLLKAKHQPGIRERRLEEWEKFRHESYKQAVKNLLYKEFKGLSRSTIKAVLAENNHDYARSRSTLVDISTKSWRFAVSAWWYRRTSVKKDVDAFPKLTQCPELDRELFNLGEPKRREQIETDGVLASQLNEREYASINDLVECQCCFGDYAWEEILACHDGHFFCKTCTGNALKECMYGQAKHIRLDKCSITCLSATANPACQAYVPETLLRQRIPEDAMMSLERKVAEESLYQSKLKIHHCPFCSYAEVDEIMPYRIKKHVMTMFYIFAFLFFISTPLILSLFITLLWYSLPKLPIKGQSGRKAFSISSLYTQFESSVQRLQNQTRGQVFSCKTDSKTCGKKSCKNCNQVWSAFHKCYEKEEDNFRIFVERAMAEAVKRTCPICSISFVKSDGCNKLVCVCGYVMCYLCRADISQDGYHHFCQHFRQIPGTQCRECDKCDLYLQEDDAQIIKMAAKKAQEEYFRTSRLPSNWNIKADSVIGNVRLSDVDSSKGNMVYQLSQGNIANDLYYFYEGVVDSILERVLEWEH